MPANDVAIFSDVHGNLPALEAVLTDIAVRGIKEMLCLGDIVGYGGKPAECVPLREAGLPEQPAEFLPGVAHPGLLSDQFTG